MIAVDTNVLLRLLVDDDMAPDQCRAARRLVARAGAVSISATVLLETIWTLSRSFGFSRKQVARVASEMLSHPKYRIQDSRLFESAIACFGASNIDFADAVALEHARSLGIDLYTFDKKLAALDGAHKAA